ncbi:hypothetical protein [Faecalitalea cylindroides]|uniref:hypothetical protein n=1 Tax=Faecalitalea cylindroides TaxID=39483 RepID=UPI0022E02287|nr:hypothetical protein [Faecalitalea cylindroides]
MIQKMNSFDFEKVYKLVCDLEETCFDLDKMKMIMNELIHSHDIFVFKDNDNIIGYLDLKKLNTRCTIVIKWQKLLNFVLIQNIEANT